MCSNPSRVLTKDSNRFRRVDIEVIGFGNFHSLVCTFRLPLLRLVLPVHLRSEALQPAHWHPRTLFETIGDTPDQKTKQRREHKEPQHEIADNMLRIG